MHVQRRTSQPKQHLANVKAIEEIVKVSRSTAGVGVDQSAFSLLSSLELE